MQKAHPDEVQVVYWRWRRWVGLSNFFILSTLCALRGARIAHLHWWRFNVDQRFPFSKSISGLTSRAALRWLIFLRFRLIWTVHNITPHEAQTRDDLQLAKEVAAAASSLIVHSPSVVAMLAERSIPIDRVAVISQGSYIDTYQAPANRTEARRLLGLDPDQKIVLFFGLIRGYKGVAELIQTWQSQERGARLFIVGQAVDLPLVEQLQTMAKDDSSIELRFGRVEEDDVPLWISAADFVCLPFTKVTTSSSAVLALSLSVPVIAPMLGTLADLPEDTGYFYDPDDGLGLNAALNRALQASDEDRAMRAHAALEFAGSTSWSMISEETFNLYLKVLETPQPQRSKRGKGRS